MTKDEALKLALEALERLWNDGFEGYPAASHESAITAIKEALAEQPAQQPDIDWKDQYEKQKRRAEMWIAKYEEDIGPLEKAGPVTAQQPENQLDDINVVDIQAQQQVPYGWKVLGVSRLFMGEFAEYEAKAEAKRIGGTSVAFPLYTSPRPSKPLTDEEIDKLCPQFEDPMRRQMWIVGFKAAREIKEN